MIVGRQGSTGRPAGRSPPRRWLAALALAAVLLAVLVHYLLRNRGPGPPPAAELVARASIAVLPLADSSPARDQAAFCDGLAEDLIHQLAQQPGLRVAGRISSFSFRGRDVDARGVAQALGVRHLIEGSIQRAGSRVRVSARLVDAHDGAERWSQSYERRIGDVPALQEQIVAAVAASLSLVPRAGGGLRTTGGTRNAEAYDAWLAARARTAFVNEEYEERSIALLERAVVLDSEFGVAWSALAFAYATQRSPQSLPRENAQLAAKALHAASRALEFAPESPRVLAAVGVVAWDLKDWDESERRLRKAVALSGATDYDALHNYGWFLMSAGRPREALETFRQAQEVEPLLQLPVTSAESALIDMGRLEEARAEAVRGARLHDAGAYVGENAFLRATIGRDAVEVRQALEMLPKGALQSAVRAGIGNARTGATMLRRIVADPRRRTGAAELDVIAHWAVYFGDEALALEALAEAAEQDDFHAFQLWRPDFAGLRATPGFKDLVRRQGLVDYWRATGSWGEYCRPLGQDDFQCS